MFRRFHLIGLLAAFMCISACSGEVLTGRVVRVTDGDTIIVLDAANARHKIRFHGIDAPESYQAFGQKSKQYLSDYVAGKDVTVTWKSKDKYGRILGTVWIGSANINLQMLRGGYVWHYKRFDSNLTYAAAKSDARAARRGLWSTPIPFLR